MGYVAAGLARLKEKMRVWQDRPWCSAGQQYRLSVEGGEAAWDLPCPAVRLSSSTYWSIARSR